MLFPARVLMQLLLMALLASLVAAPLPDPTQHGVQRKQVAVDLVRGVAQDFLDCVCAIPRRHYRIAVIQGWTIVIPNGNRDLNFETTDRALLECVQSAAEDMLIQIGSRSSGKAEYMVNGEPMSVFEVEVDDLVRLGARSIAYVTDDIPDGDGHRKRGLALHQTLVFKSKRHLALLEGASVPHDLDDSQVLRRGAVGRVREETDAGCCGISKPKVVNFFKPKTSSHVKRWPHQDEYYCTFPSEYTGCHDLDLRTHQYGQCYSVWMPYRSIMAANSHGDRLLRFDVWPHHNCNRGNVRIFVVPTNALSVCIEGRLTYSHDASLISDPKSDPARQIKTKSERQQEQVRRSQEATRKRKEWKLTRAQSFGRDKQAGGTPPAEVSRFRFCSWLRTLTKSFERRRQADIGRSWRG